MDQHAAAIMPAPGPVGPAVDRIGAIDACRGFALLGIFIVNIALFSRPLGEMLNPNPIEGASLGEEIAHYVTAIFFSGKFYAQFSMLFGMGLVLQMTRVEGRGRSFAPLYLRRLAFLLLLGACHAVFLWYGDILFTYATAGVVLLLGRKARARTMFTIAGVLLAWCSLLTVGMAAIGTLSGGSPSSLEASPKVHDGPAPVDSTSAEPSPGETTPAETNPPHAGSDQTSPAEPVAADPSAAETSVSVSDPVAENDWERTPLGRLFKGMSDEKNQGPTSKLWMDTEREIFQHGGYWQATGLRLMIWLGFLVFEALGFWWHVVAMFFLGAGLLKAGLFEKENIGWHGRFVVLGVTVGLPLSVLAALAPRIWSNEALAGGITGLATYLAGPLMGLMYIGIVTKVVHAGTAPRLATAIARVGRMALTNYLMQTVIATTIFYWFGLGLFDQVSGHMAMAIVLGIYLAQVAISNLWMKHFLYGPMEWLWRSVTYLKMQPVLRVSMERPGRSESGP